MHKIIHSTFQLDLRAYNVSIVEENYWFTDRFFTKYSFPFTLYLTEELKKVFGYFLDDRNVFIETEFEVTYVFGNIREKGIFQIEDQVGEKLRANIRYGFDELPNYDKKLSELPLQSLLCYKEMLPLSFVFIS